MTVLIFLLQADHPVTGTLAPVQQTLQQATLDGEQGHIAECHHRLRLGLGLIEGMTGLQAAAQHGLARALLAHAHLAFEQVIQRQGFLPALKQTGAGLALHILQGIQYLLLIGG